MPIVDMPLEKLKVYQGRNPKPADFDAFWDKSIKELYAVDPNFKMEKANIKSNIGDCYYISFTSIQGAKITGKMVKPKNIEGKVPAIIGFHGLGGCCWSFNALITYASQGYAMFTMDSRGQGGGSEDVGGPGTSQVTMFMRGFDGEPEQMYLRNLFLDTAQIARIVLGLDYVDENRVGVMGGSQGGGLSIACAALEPRIARCCSTYPYMSDYKRVWEMDLAKGAYDGLKNYFRNRDPRHEREDEIFEKLGYVDIQFLAPKVKANVMMATGLMDTTCPPSTQFAMYNKLTCEKQVVIYPDFGHEGLKGQDEIEFNFMADL